MIRSSSAPAANVSPALRDVTATTTATTGAMRQTVVAATTSLLAETAVASTVLRSVMDARIAAMEATRRTAVPATSLPVTTGRASVAFTDATALESAAMEATKTTAVSFKRLRGKCRVYE